MIIGQSVVETHWRKIFICLIFRYDDRYAPSRYDDRYNVRPLGPSSQYDRYDTQYGNNYRGNGYDNTDPNYYYEQSRRDPYGGRGNFKNFSYNLSLIESF